MENSAILCYNHWIIRMKLLGFARRLLTMAQLSVIALLPWYFLEMPMRIVKAYFTYFRVFNEIIGFQFLLSTLFSPWKSIVDEYPKSGYIDLNRVLQALTMNITSRTIGFAIRGSTIVFGIAVQAAIFLAALAYFFFWITFPILGLASSHFLMVSLFPS